MAKEKTLLTIAKTVAADTEEAVSITPANGKTVIVKTLMSSVSNGKDAVVCLMWDYGGAGETLIVSAKMDKAKVIGTGDGTKKVALVLSNRETTDSVVMSGESLIEVI